MPRVYVLQAAPLMPIGTSAVAVRLAGGGVRAYSGYKGFTDWRAGLVGPPRFTNAIGFDQGGPTGGAVPTVGVIVFGSTDQALLSTLASYYWKGSRVTLESGDDSAGPVTSWTTEIQGTVAGVTFDSGFLKITVSDLSGDLSNAVAPAIYGGTGGLDGGAESVNRVKRVAFGRLFNVEGLLTDAANNIYEFGDGATPIQEFSAVRDKGVVGTTTVLADQGSPALTFAALQAATVIAGGGVVAPSIRRVKWWTQPSGPLTADIKGDAAGGYVEYASAVVARVLSTYAPSIVFANASAFDTACHRVAGQLGDNGSETVAAFLDRLLSPLGFTWTVDAAGNLNVRKFTFASPVETITSNSVERQAVLQPLRTRSVGYQANNRRQSGGEVAASVTDGSANAWTPVLVNFVQQGGSFISSAFTTDYDNSIKSAEAWPQARASIIVNAIGDAFGIALNDPTTGNHWGVRVSAAGDYLFNRNEDFTFDSGANAAIGDVVEILHNGTEIRATVNGNDLGTEITTGVSPATAFQIFANVRRPGEIVRNPTFSRSGTGGVGSVTLKNRSNMAIVGNSATKVAGSSAYGNASFYSGESYYGAYLAFTVAQMGTEAYVGFRSVGTSYAGFSSLGYGWHLASSGTAYCRYGGSDHESTSYAIGDTFQTIDDLTNVTYFKNGVLIATAASNAVGRFLDSDVSTLGNRFDNITFGPSGSAAGSGALTATITLYKRATSTPTGPTTTGTYTFSTATIAFSGGGANGWTQAVPAGTDPLYTIAATAFASGTSDTIATGEWTSAVLFSQNQVVASLYLYQRSATTPGLPTGTATYTVSTAAITFPGGGANSWSTTIPAANGNPLWVTTATANTTTATDTVANTEWAAAQIMAQDGATGPSGYNTATIMIYQRAASAPTLPSAATSYTFATATLTGLNNGWTTSIPAANGNPLYASAATASATSGSDVILAAEWASPVILAQDGSGLNSASVFIYQRATSTPALPSATATYTFATAALAGLNNGWSQTIPAGTNPIYVSTATAAATGSSDTITSGEWAAAAILSQNGAAGANGGDGIGTTSLGLVGAASFNGNMIDCAHNAGDFWTVDGAYSTQLTAGSVSVSYKAPNAYGVQTDFFVGLGSAVGAGLGFGAWNLGAIRHAAQSTTIGTSTTYHTEIWIGGTNVAFDKPWDGTYTYTIRYDFQTGAVTMTAVATNGTVFPLYSGNVGAGKSAGLIVAFGIRGRVANLAYGAAGANGSPGSSPFPVTKVNNTAPATYNYPYTAKLNAGGSLTVTGFVNVLATGSGVTVTTQLGYSINGGGFTYFSTQSATASPSEPNQIDINQVISNTTGAPCSVDLQLLTSKSGSGTWQATGSSFGINSSS